MVGRRKREVGSAKTGRTGRRSGIAKYAHTPAHTHMHSYICVIPTAVLYSIKC